MDLYNVIYAILLVKVVFLSKIRLAYHVTRVTNIIEAQVQMHKINVNAYLVFFKMS